MKTIEPQITAIIDNADDILDSIIKSFHVRIPDPNVKVSF